MRICPRCKAAPLAKRAKLCEDCRKICPRCGKTPKGPGGKLCNPCHAMNMRHEPRKAYSDLTEEQKRYANALGMAKYYRRKGLVQAGPCFVRDCEGRPEIYLPDAGDPKNVVWACRRHRLQFLRPGMGRAV